MLGRHNRMRWFGWMMIVLAALALASAGCESDKASSKATPSVVVHVGEANAAAQPNAPEMLDGIPVGFTEEGYPYQGAADAPVTLIEFSDYLCPFCARHATQTAPELVKRYVRTGQVKWIFRDSPIASLHPTSAQGHIAAQCVGEQGAALFWRMHDQLFTKQSEWSGLAAPSAYLAQIAQNVGADAAAYSACLASGRGQAVVNQGLADAAALGFTGTPSFQFRNAEGSGPYTLVGAQPVEVFSQWLDALLGNNPPPATPTPAPQPTAALPLWASPEGLAADPERPGYTVAGDPYRGDPGAPMTVVEFSDFQCPVCRTHALEVQPALDHFVESGQVQWVFKNLPLRMHPQSAVAAAAAVCAGEQAKFWEMHHLLFQEVDRGAVEPPEPPLEALAAQLGLDGAAFAAGLHGRAAMERVLSDVYDAQQVGNSTPLFVLLYGGTGRVVRGSLPVDQFEKVLQDELQKATASQ